MMNLIKSELYRVRKEKYLLFIILGVIGILAIPIFVICSDMDTGGCIGVRNILNTNYVVINKDSNMSIEILKSADIITLLFLPVICSVCLADFSNGTIKNTIISGYSRSKIYFSKLIVCIIVCMSIVLFYSIVAYIMHILKFGYNGNFSLNLVLQTLKVILISMPIYVSVVTTGFMIGILTKRKSIVLSIFLLYQVIITLLVIIVGKVIVDFGKYEPISLLDKVAHISTNTFNDNLTFILVGCLIVMVTVIISIFRINKMDIKQ